MDGSGMPDAPQLSCCVRPFSTTGISDGHDVILGNPDGSSVSRGGKQNKSNRQFRITIESFPSGWLPPTVSLEYQRGRSGRSGRRGIAYQIYFQLEEDPAKDLWCWNDPVDESHASCMGSGSESNQLISFA